MDEYFGPDDIALVLPAKTKLNSTAYFPFDGNDNSDKMADYYEEKSRKICNDTNIPSYRGFSIANQHYNKSKLKSTNNYGNNGKSVVRKVSKPNPRSDKPLSTSFLKVYSRKPTTQETVKPTQSNNKVDAETKRVNTFWVDDHISKPLHKLETNSTTHVKERGSSTKHYDKMEIDKFIKRRKEAEKELQKQKRFEKIKKAKKDDENLKKLSLHIKEKASITNQKSVVVKPVLKEQNQFDKYQHESPIVSQTNSLVSSYDGNSAQYQIHNWEPLAESQIQSIQQFDRDQMAELSEQSAKDAEITRRCEAIYKILDDTREKFGYKRKNDVQRWSKEDKAQFLANYQSLDSDTEQSSQYADFHGRYDAETQTNPLQFIVNNMKHILETRHDRDTSLTGDLIGCLRAENQQRYMENRQNQRTQLSKPIAEKIRLNKPVPFHRNKEKIGSPRGFSMLKTDGLRFINVHKQKMRQKTELKNPDVNYTPTETSGSSTLTKESISNSVNIDEEYDNNLFSKQGSSSNIDHSNHDNWERVEVNQDDKTNVASTSLMQSLTDDESLVSLLFDERNRNRHITAPITNEGPIKNEDSMNSKSKQHPAHPNKYRYSPSALESQFLAALHHDDALMTGYINLVETERLQGVSMAQQETASLVQIAESRKRQLENMTTHAARLDRQERSRAKKNGSSSSDEESVSSSASSRPSSSSSKSKKKGVNRKSLTETISDASEIQEIIINEEAPIGHTKRSINSSVSIPDNVEVPEETIEDTKDRSISKVEISTNISSNTKSTTTSSTKTSSLANPKELSSVLSQAISSKKRNSSTHPSESIKELSNINTNRSTRAETITTEKPSIHTTNNNPSYSTNTFHDDSEHVVEDDDGTLSSTQQNDSINNKSIAELLNIQISVYALETQLRKKNNTLAKLKNRLAIKKYQKQEESLQNQIKLLNEQKASVTKEIENLNTTASVVYQSIDMDNKLLNSSTESSTSKNKSKSSKTPSTLPSKTPKSASTTTTVTSSTTSSSSSDNTISKSGDIKTEIPSVTSEPSEPKSEIGRKKRGNDASLSKTSSVTSVSAHKSPNNDKGNNENDCDDGTLKDSDKIEEVDTARSLKQLQFGDINEEYSASDHEDSLKSNPHKPNLSASTNRDLDSSEPKYRVLNLKPDVKTSETVDEKQPVSARTIHSEISEIPEECDADDLTDEPGSKVSSRRCQDYSDDFSEVSTTRYSYKEEEDDINDQDDDNNDASEKSVSVSSSVTKTDNKINDSAEESRPETPPRKNQQKKVQKADEADEISNSDASIGKVANKISDYILNLTLKDVSADKLVVVDDKNVENMQHNDDGIPKDSKNVTENHQSQIPIDKDVIKTPLEEIVPKLYDNFDDDDDDDDDDRCAESKNDSNIVNKTNGASFQFSNKGKIDLTKDLMEIEDIEVTKLMHISIDHILQLRQSNIDNIHQTNKSTCEVLREAYESRNIPTEVLEENNEQRSLEIFDIISNFDLSISDIFRRFLSKEMVYKLILEWAYVVYELENVDSITQKQDGNWRTQNKFELYKFGKEKSLKFKLWRGLEEPATKKQFEPIIHDHLCNLFLLSTNHDGSPRSSDADVRSRIHQWCVDRNKDEVDRLLVDEIYREDCQWHDYEPIEISLKQQFANDIAENIVSENIAIGWL